MDKMTEVKADIEYKIEVEDKSFVLDKKKYNLLNNINTSESITDAAKLTGISYRTALNHIYKIETVLGINIVNTKKGGSGGGGKTTLTEEGFSILKECKKINAITELHKDVNEVEAIVKDIDKSKKIMIISINDKITINIPLKEEFAVGDKVLALISYDNIFLIVEPCNSSIRNVIKGTIAEMKMDNQTICVKIDIGGVYLFSDITVSAEKDLDLELGKEIYIGFKAMSVATLKA